MRGNVLKGIIKRHPDGFGFFIPEDSSQPDAYISKKNMNGVMTQDKVEVEIYPERGGDRFRGTIQKILERAHKRVIGKFHDLDGINGLLIDESNGWDTNLLIQSKWRNNAKDGDFVVAEVLTYPSKNESFTGKIIEVLGEQDAPLFDIKRVIYENNIPFEFPQEVLQESEQLPDEPGEKDFKDRKDLRNLPFVTIDGQTAKDFDDAIYVESNNEGFKVYVAIADVSHYVRTFSATDKEAYHRGTSTYFPNFVVPMLPEKLSNGLCSLKPDVNRLAMVAEIQMSFVGDVIVSKFYEAVIKSHARLTYGIAQEIVDGNTPEEFHEVSQVVLRAADAAKLLMSTRFKKGTLDFDIPETVILVDETGQPQDIVKTQRLFAHRLIEELMLLANVEVANFIFHNNRPALYRIHEPPKVEKIETLNLFLHNFGSTHKLGEIKLQKKITTALEEFKGKPEQQILNILALRSMNQAKYHMDNIGHFGLGFEKYAHFTSPIRRYPDLIVHRVIKDILGIPGYTEIAPKDLGTAGNILSACEQRSVKAERQVEAIKKARFMSRFLGKEFDGVVSSVTKFGVFILLQEYNVDGLIKVEELGDDRFIYDEQHLKLIGKNTGIEFSLGTPVKVIVASTDSDNGQIDFVLADSAARPSRKKKNSGDKRGASKKRKSNRKNSKKRGKSQKDSKRVRKERVPKRSRKSKTR